MPDVFKIEELPGPIALLTFDAPDKKVNTLSNAVLQDLDQIAVQLGSRTDLHGFLLRSGKAGQFIAGADLHELAHLVYLPTEEVPDALGQGNAVFNRLSDLPFPTLSLIDGACMGGGTELSLSLDERLASNSPRTRIGLPEVTIGIIPGWGGTQRLPRLVGLHHAIEMICSGEPVTAEKAASIGLVFDAVPPERLVDEGCRVAEFLYASGQWKAMRAVRRQGIGLTPDQMAFSFECAEERVRAKAKGQPSPSLVALKALRQGVNLPLAEGLAVERKTTQEVYGTEMSANLIGVFFMNTALARDRGIADQNVQPRPVLRAGVLGAGQMGAGIAGACARNDIPCTMVDVSEERLADGMARAEKVVADRIELGLATPDDMVQFLRKLNPSTSHSPFADGDVVIEAITEDEGRKAYAYRQLAGVLRDDAILATSTSTISISRLAKAVKHPEKFVGMHFFFPVDRMQLVEVIRGDQTSDQTVVTVVELVRRLRKTPIVCSDRPGFLVNRIVFPYLNEAVLLLLEGAGMDQIDNVVTRFGFPMGPFALQDFVGLDTIYCAAEGMLASFGDRIVETPLLGDLVRAGRLGKRSGAGFRRFTGKRQTPAADPDFAPILERRRIASRPVTDDEIEGRLLLVMLLEAMRALDERIVKKPMHVDMGLMLGFSFPRHRGGLLKWCDNVGAARLLERNSRYVHLGERFEPPEQLVSMAHSGAKFYPRLK